MILVVGEPQKRYRVSSVFMSHGSPVFAAMLSEKYAEGQDLSATNPKEVPLPDDDPDTILLLCQLLHLRQDALPEMLPVDQLLTLATTTDKYQFAGSICMVGENWLQKQETPIMPESQVWKMINIAYLFGLKKQFCHLTHLFLYSFPSSYLEGVMEIPESDALSGETFRKSKALEDVGNFN